MRSQALPMPRVGWHRAVGLAAAVTVLFGLQACGNQLPKEQLLADARGGDSLAQDAGVTGAPLSGGAAPDARGGDSPGRAAGVPGTSLSGGTAPDAGLASGPAGSLVPGAITSGQAATASLGSAGSGPGTSSAPKGKPVKAATSPGAAPAKCTGPLSEIAIGTVGGQSGFIGAAVHGGVEAVKAWVAETNAKGGLACHPIVYYVADDGGDPAKNAALTQQMLEEHHVIAMIFSNNPLSSQGGKPILERAHVATIGSEGASDYFNSDPDFFPTAATSVKLIDASYAMMSGQLTPDQKAHLGALTCIEAALCSQFGAATGDKYATSNGMTLVFNAGATMVQPDYTSNCQSAKNAGVKALFVVGDSGMLSRTIRSCKRIDFNPVFASSPVGLAPSVSELPDLDGVILSSTTRPWTANDPQAQRYLSTLAKYVPGALPGGAGAVGWGSALVLEQAGKNLPVNPTKDDIYAGLWTIKNNNFNGYLAPLTYAKDKAAVYPVCWWPMVIRNKAWVALDNGAGGCHK